MGIDVRRLAVGQYQHQLFVGRAGLQVVCRVAHGGTHARRITRLHGGQTRLGIVIPAFAITLDVQVAHIVTGVGMKTRDSKRIAELFYRPGQQGHRFLAEFENGLIRTRRLFIKRFGQIQQQHDGDVAAVGAMTHVDARVRVSAPFEVDQRTNGHIQIKLTAFFLITDADLVLGLQEVKDAFQTLGQRTVFFQQFIDIRRVAFRVQGLVNTHPVGAVGQRLVVPFWIVTRRQAFDLVAVGALFLFLEHLFIVAFLDEDPHLTVIIAVIDHGIVEVDLGVLVALAAGLSDITQGQRGNVFRIRFTLRHQRVEALGES